MNDFTLDRRLREDCTLLRQDDELSYLLHDNAEVLWIILVPHTRQTEFYLLPLAMQLRLLNEITRISECLQTKFSCDKINVATIGNVVSQLHIHVIGRRHDDAYWPDVVWGKPLVRHHAPDTIESIEQRLLACLDKSE